MPDASARTETSPLGIAARRRRVLHAIHQMELGPDATPAPSEVATPRAPPTGEAGGNESPVAGEAVADGNGNAEVRERVVALVVRANEVAARAAREWTARGPPAWLLRYDGRELFGLLLWDAARGDGDPPALPALAWAVSALESQVGGVGVRAVVLGPSSAPASVAFQEGFAALREWMRAEGVHNHAGLSEYLRT